MRNIFLQRKSNDLVQATQNELRFQSFSPIWNLLRDVRTCEQHDYRYHWYFPNIRMAPKNWRKADIFFNSDFQRHFLIFYEFLCSLIWFSSRSRRKVLHIHDFKYIVAPLTNALLYHWVNFSALHKKSNTLTLMRSPPHLINPSHFFRAKTFHSEIPNRNSIHKTNTTILILLPQQLIWSQRLR